MNGYLIALIVFLAWIGMVYVLNRIKWFEKHSMALQGPFIMWKTERGKKLIDRLASRRRLWEVYGKLSLWICAGAMAIIMTLLLWEATIVTQVDRAPSPELILGIPGINPVIPVGYGILGLVIAIIVHEFAHGILTRVGDMKVRTLGLVFLVFPVGAFVEPDEEALKNTTRSKRSKVFAAGPIRPVTPNRCRWRNCTAPSASWSRAWRGLWREESLRARPPRWQESLPVVLSSQSMTSPCSQQRTSIRQYTPHLVRPSISPTHIRARTRTLRWLTGSLSHL